jgi:hypothetical protein
MDKMLTPKMLVPVIAGIVGVVGIGIGVYAMVQMNNADNFGRNGYPRMGNEEGMQRGGFGDNSCGGNNPDCPRMGMGRDQMGQGKGDGNRGAQHMTLFDQSAPITPITDEAKNAILKALDDEYKAYATYSVIINKFGPERPFSNIIQAEQMHIDSLIQLLDRYSVEVPENTYLESDIQIGSSIEANCTAGAELEKLNVDLYNSLLQDVEGFDDITLVFEHLKDASNLNHLPALERCSAN